jgi:hypothetical protein
MNKNLTLKEYLSNILKFLSITVFDIFPQTFGMIFFNIAGEKDQMGNLGFIISSFYFFFCLAFNHSEIINLKSGIHYSKGDYMTANAKICQCIIINLVFYFLSILVVFQCKHIFRFFGIYGEFLESVSYYVPLYCLMAGTFFMITCWLRGIQ